MVYTMCSKHDSQEPHLYSPNIAFRRNGYSLKPSCGFREEFKEKTSSDTTMILMLIDYLVFVHALLGSLVVFLFSIFTVAYISLTYQLHMSLDRNMMRY